MKRIVDAIISRDDRDDSGVCITYSEEGSVCVADVRERVEQLSEELLAVGVGPGLIVGVEDDFEDWNWIAAMLAIWKVGGVYMPLSPERAKDEASRPTPHVVLKLGSPWEGPELILAKTSVSSAPSNAAYVIPTSGSTDSSRWVLGTSEGLAHFIEWEIRALRVSSKDTVSQLTPPSFDPVFRDVLVPLVAGARLSLLPRRSMVTAPEQLLPWMRRHGITLIHTIPTVIRSWYTSAVMVQLDQVRAVLVAGEPFYAHDIDQWKKRFGTTAQLVNLYGPTETTLAAFFHFVEPSRQYNGVLPVGDPIDGVSAAIVDEGNSPRAPYEIGQILIRTPYASLGYPLDEAATATRFIKNPLDCTDTVPVFRTGDLGFRNDRGELVIVGRTDSVYKVRGSRIDVGLVESAIRSISGVSDAAAKVVHVPGVGDLLVAYFSGSATVKAVQKAAGQILRQGHFPHRWEKLQELPYHASGKINRRLLPIPESPTEPTHRAQESSLLVRLRAIWAGALPFAALFGDGDEFYSLGGGSIEAAQICAQVKDTIGVTVPLRTFLQLGTISSVAEYIVGALEETQPFVDKTDRANVLTPLSARMAPLTGSQLRFWKWLTRGVPDQMFQFCWASKLTGKVDLNRLLAACQFVVRRHVALNVEIAADGDRVYQRVMEMTPVVQLLPLLDDSENGAFELARRDALAKCSEPFRLGYEPLIRIFLYTLPDASAIIVLNSHILASDGWTRGLLLRDISGAYNYGNQQLPQINISFIDYALWEASEKVSWSLADSHWEPVLRSLEPASLPFCSSPGLLLNGFSRTICETLDNDVTLRIRSGAGRRGLTPAAVHASAFAVALSALSSTDRGHLIFSHPKRYPVGAESIVGSFTDSVILPYSNASRGMTSTFARSLHDKILLALQDGAPSFDYLVERFRPDIDPCVPKWFPAIFALQPGYAGDLSLTDTVATPLPWTLQRSIWSLELYPVFVEGKTLITLNYSTEVFAENDGRRVMESYVANLAAFLET